MKVGEIFYNIGFGKDFFDTISKAQKTEVKISKLDFIKIRKFCISMENIMNEDITEWEEIFTSHI